MSLVGFLLSEFLVNKSKTPVKTYQPKKGRPMKITIIKTITIKDNDNYEKILTKSLFRMILNSKKISIFEL